MEAVILAGGRSRRMGVDKLSLERDGRTALQRVRDSVAPHVTRVVVAGPERPGCDGVVFVYEDPPFGGPVAGIITALPELNGESTFLLAGDLANPAAVVRLLLDHRRALLDHDAVVLEDADGWSQWLAGMYRTRALRDAAAALGVARDISVRRFMRTVGCLTVPAAAAALADLDTPEQARDHGFHSPGDYDAL